MKINFKVRHLQIKQQQEQLYCPEVKCAREVLRSLTTTRKV